MSLDEAGQKWREVEMPKWQGVFCASLKYRHFEDTPLLILQEPLADEWS